MTELTGGVICVLAVAGVVMNNRRVIWCFPIWLVSNILSAGLHAHAGLWAMVARDGAFFVLAIHGWYLWAKTHKKNTLN